MCLFSPNVFYRCYISALYVSHSVWGIPQAQPAGGDGRGGANVCGTAPGPERAEGGGVQGLHRHCHRQMNRKVRLGVFLVQCHSIKILFKIIYFLIHRFCQLFFKVVKPTNIISATLKEFACARDLRRAEQVQGFQRRPEARTGHLPRPGVSLRCYIRSVVDLRFLGLGTAPPVPTGSRGFERSTECIVG